MCKRLGRQGRFLSIYVLSPERLDPTHGRFGEQATTALVRIPLFSGYRLGSRWESVDSDTSGLSLSLEDILFIGTPAGRKSHVDQCQTSTAAPIRTLAISVALIALVCAAPAFAHEIGGRDAAFVAATRGPAPGAFLYLGAKHMVTGYDHLLFLAGVVFFLRRWRDVLVYVSLFSLGHSVTLLAGTLLGFGLNAWLVDAVIGASVVWKAFDNLGGFEQVIGWRPEPKVVVLLFGFVHGLGLSTKLNALRLHREGLVANLISFNVGVELGQLMALSIVLAALALLRRTRAFAPTAIALNWAIMVAGFVLMGFRLAGYAWGKAT